MLVQTGAWTCKQYSLSQTCKQYSLSQTCKQYSLSQTCKQYSQSQTGTIAQGQGMAVEHPTSMMHVRQNPGLLRPRRPIDFGEQGRGSGQAKHPRTTSARHMKRRSLGDQNAHVWNRVSVLVRCDDGPPMGSILAQHSAALGLRRAHIKLGIRWRQSSDAGCAGLIGSSGSSLEIRERARIGQLQPPWQRHGAA
jgi:hypothetical protein